MELLEKQQAGERGRASAGGMRRRVKTLDSEEWLSQFSEGRTHSLG